MSSLPLPPDTPDRVEAVLVTNGHANPYVEPLMEGWIKQQADHGRKIEFMHLDAFVDWIMDHDLVNELRVALREQGIEMIQPFADRD
jgi:hypothetical protein